MQRRDNRWLSGSDSATKGGAAFSAGGTVELDDLRASGMPLGSLLLRPRPGVGARPAFGPIAGATGRRYGALGARQTREFSLVLARRAFSACERLPIFRGSGGASTGDLVRWWCGLRAPPQVDLGEPRALAVCPGGACCKVVRAVGEGGVGELVDSGRRRGERLGKRVSRGECGRGQIRPACSAVVVPDEQFQR